MEQTLRTNSPKMTESDGLARKIHSCGFMPARVVRELSGRLNPKDFAAFAGAALEVADTMKLPRTGRYLDSLDLMPVKQSFTQLAECINSGDPGSAGEALQKTRELVGACFMNDERDAKIHKAYGMLATLKLA